MRVSSQRNNPGLIILVDLGAEASGIKTIKASRVSILGFTVNGSSSDDCKCLSPDMSRVFELLLDIRGRGPLEEAPVA